MFFVLKFTCFHLQPTLFFQFTLWHCEYLHIHAALISSQKQSRCKQNSNFHSIFAASRPTSPALYPDDLPSRFQLRECLSSSESPAEECMNEQQLESLVKVFAHCQETPPLFTCQSGYTSFLDTWVDTVLGFSSYFLHKFIWKESVLGKLGLYFTLLWYVLVFVLSLFSI